VIGEHVQLDSNADGILNEEEFLQSLYLVTRSQKHKDTAQGSAPESDSLEGDTPAAWKSIRIKYSQVAESRAHVQVDVQRIEVNLTIEPLEMILAILDEMNSDSTLQAPPPEKAQTLGAPSHDACAGVLGARSEPLAKNEDDGPVGWMRSISERAFLRPSDTIRARSLDIQVRMGSVDMAVIPRSDSELLCDNALVFQMLSLEFSSKVDKNNLPCEYLCANGEGSQCYSRIYICLLCMRQRCDALYTLCSMHNRLYRFSFVSHQHSTVLTHTSVRRSHGSDR